MADRCAVPPPGWTCSRAAGHDGPCAARPTPYVGGHPEMPLHPFEDAGDGTCAACLSDEERLIQAVTNASNTDQWGIYRNDGGPALWTDRRQAVRAIAREFRALGGELSRSMATCRHEDCELRFGPRPHGQDIARALGVEP